MYRLWIQKALLNGRIWIKPKSLVPLAFVYRRSCIAQSREHVFKEVANVGASRERLGDIEWTNYLPPTSEWGYDAHDGPDIWVQKYPAAGGQHQSPINIVTSSANSSTDLNHRPLTWSYGSQICKSLLNTGCGWKVDVQGDESVLSGGPLEHNYQLVQFHCHWGKTSSCGSEHTVDGKVFSGELHFVHWNKDLYSSFPEAACSPKGLAVLGVFLTLGEKNSEVDKLCKCIENITYKDEQMELPADLDPTYLFPLSQSYWTYEGSLTTPPCYESVTWIVFKQPIEVTEEQLECFRKLRCYCQGEECPAGKSQGEVIQNFRPPQAVNDREIKDCTYH